MPTNKQKVAVVALGGNAVTKKGQRGTVYEQFANTRATIKVIYELILRGYKVVLTHGNGPQVGDRLVQAEQARDKIPMEPLGVMVAGTQGSLGYMIQQILQNKLLQHGFDIPVATVLTQVVVDRYDPMLLDPCKPIGHKFYSKEEAERLMAEEDWILKEDSGRGWRRVAPSPYPLEIVELDTIQRLLDSGAIVIAAGGGGIPVVIEQNGSYEGVDAVIDKDLASGLLAKSIDADLLIMLTAVEQVGLDFTSGTPRWIDKMTIHEAKQYMREGHFPAGSMGPKIQAAIDYLLGVRRKQTRKAIITDYMHLLDALEGNAGTQITFQ